MNSSPSTNFPINTYHPSTHQGWNYLALAVGSLVLGLGIFGGVGLLQSHGLISISKPVASFLGKLGATPHHVSLWVTAVGGISAGGVLCGLNIHKICKKNPINDPSAFLYKFKKRDPATPLHDHCPRPNQLEFLVQVRQKNGLYDVLAAGNSSRLYVRRNLSQEQLKEIREKATAQGWKELEVPVPYNPFTKGEQGHALSSNWGDSVLRKGCG